MALSRPRRWRGYRWAWPAGRTRHLRHRRGDPDALVLVLVLGPRAHAALGADPAPRPLYRPGVLRAGVKGGRQGPPLAPRHPCGRARTATCPPPRTLSAALARFSLHRIALRMAATHVPVSWYSMWRTPRSLGRQEPPMKPPSTKKTERTLGGNMPVCGLARKQDFCSVAAFWNASLRENDTTTRSAAALTRSSTSCMPLPAARTRT